MKRWIFIIISIITIQFVKAQQSPMYTQYMFNAVTVNPAYAASMEEFQAALLTRVQWVSIEGAPITETVTLHGPILKEKIGVGLSLTNDEIGPIQQTGLAADFAYQIQLNKRQYLSMGIKGGLSFYQANLSELKLIEDYDPAFENDVEGKFMPTLGFGLYYYTNKFYVGFSSPNIMKNQYLDDYSVQSVSLGREERHYYLMGGYAFEINRDLVFKPSAMMKMVSGSPVSFDLNASFYLYKRLWLGATYRVGDAVCFMAEVNVGRKFMLGYAYDYTLSKLTHFNSGTHEILLSYKFNRLKNARLKSPRYF